ncbi:hypothetical protein OCU04_007801 [Sclerotinia nivalis]|uniref:Uncharacterized protein n=1 Tax=Sclerotinia nivalis TaxID=352851 RepID=A0A9X0AKF7_9HELO|nr:hypothetical protein OCU04_007801 [Sclerotinia nivalis]
MDESMIPLQNVDSVVNVASYNVIPHPTSLTIKQRQDISAAVLGKPEPHKYIYLHFKHSDSGISKQIIMHQYRNHRRHDWFNQDDIDKLNLFRIAAVTLKTGFDISKGERCWRFVTKAERKEWFPRLREFVEETEAREAREAVEEAAEEASNEGNANGEVMGDAVDEAVDEPMQESIQEPARRSVGETNSGNMEEEASRGEPESDDVAFNSEDEAPSDNPDESGNEFNTTQSRGPHVYRGRRPQLPHGFSRRQIAQGMNATWHTNGDTEFLSETLQNLNPISNNGSPNTDSPFIGSPITDSPSATAPSGASTPEAEGSNSTEASDVLSPALERFINNEGYGEGFLL